MPNPAPLLILLGSLASLAIIEHWLKRPRPRAKSAQTLPKGGLNKNIGALTLLPEITVTGLDERGVEQLRNLVKSADISGAASFLAFNQSEIPEINTYINQIQKLIISNNYGLLPELDEHLLGKIVKATRLPESPAKLRVTELSDEDLAYLLIFNQNSPRIINRDLMARFGGHDFYQHFECYNSYPKHQILQIPGSNPARSSFDILAISGLAVKGRDIDMAQRLNILTLKQLKRMASDLNLKQAFRNKAEAVQALAGIQGSRALFSMQFVLDDLFCLENIDESAELIIQEWGYLSACAKLLMASQQIK